MTSRLHFVLLPLVVGAMAMASLAGCVAPPPVVVPPSAFDRSYAAIVGAMGDENVRITSQDPAAGVVTGIKGGISLTATVQRQPDGSARLDFKTRGNIAEDPKLIDRIGAAYNARMGR